MKYILSFILFFVCGSLVADHIQFETKYKIALDKAKESDKLIFVDFTATWCGPCQHMENTVFNDQDVARFFNANFVNLQLDERKNRSILSKFDVRSYPTLMFMAPDKSILLKVSGGLHSISFVNLAKSANALFDFNQRYYSDLRDSATEENLLQILNEGLGKMYSGFFENFITQAYHYLPDFQDVILTEFSSFINIDQYIEKEIQNYGDKMWNNRTIRDNLAIRYFTDNQFPQLSDINKTCKQLESLNFKNLDESRVYLSALYAYTLDVFSPIDVQNKQRLVFGKDLLIKYPNSTDNVLLLSSLYYLLDQDIEEEYYHSIIDKFKNYPEEDWSFIMHDIYSVALVKTGKKDESVIHVRIANEMAVKKGLKYRPSISRIKNKKVEK